MTRRRALKLKRAVCPEAISHRKGGGMWVKSLDGYHSCGVSVGHLRLFCSLASTAGAGRLLLELPGDRKALTTVSARAKARSGPCTTLSSWHPNDAPPTNSRVLLPPLPPLTQPDFDKYILTYHLHHQQQKTYTSVYSLRPSSCCTIANMRTKLAGIEVDQEVDITNSTRCLELPDTRALSRYLTRDSTGARGKRKQIWNM